MKHLGKDSGAAGDLRVEQAGCSHDSVTIVVATQGVRDSLAATLQALQAQACTRREILVVVNGPAFPLPPGRIPSMAGITVVHEPVSGLSRARNAGALAAGSELVAFVDDDIVVGAGWLHELLAGFADSQVMCVTGLVVPQSGMQAPESPVELREPYTIDPSQTGWYRRILQGRVGLGGNVAFRRPFLLQAGGFPADLGLGTSLPGGEEHSLFLGVLRHGFRLAHRPSALAAHCFDLTAAQHRQRLERLYSAGVAFRLKLLLEEKGHRGEVAKSMFSGLFKALGRTHHPASSPPAAKIPWSAKLRACWRGIPMLLRSYRRPAAPSAASLRVRNRG